MIKLTISAKGTQEITEVCDKCQCHVNNLTVDDILVKEDIDLNIFDSKGNEVTRTEHERQTCKCEHCNHD
tara:strand:- start:277 stop:486 length:210 start_codon:yes stop_codon:yes gene_type:complete